jgi:hypothetical protein
MQVLYAPDAVRTDPAPRGPAAWLLDAPSFHVDFDARFAELSSTGSTAAMRRRAADLWDSEDPAIRAYVARLETDLPEEWEAEFRQDHLAQWYRMLCAPHLERRSLAVNPGEVCAGLSRLGFSKAEARRIARGRQLATLARAYGSDALGEAMGLVIDPGARGWLAQDDLVWALDRLGSLPRSAFRMNQDLVPVCDQLWQTLRSWLDDHGRPVLVLSG